MESIKILMILTLVGLSLGIPIGKIVNDLEDVTTNIDDYDLTRLTPQMIEDLNKMVEALKKTKKTDNDDGSPEFEDKQELKIMTETSEDEEDIAPEDAEEMCDDCEIDLESEDKAREEFNEVIEDEDYDADESVTLSSKAIGIICVVGILGLVGATFLVLVCIRFLCRCGNSD